MGLGSCARAAAHLSTANLVGAVSKDVTISFPLSSSVVDDVASMTERRTVVELSPKQARQPKDYVTWFSRTFCRHGGANNGDFSDIQPPNSTASALSKH